MRHWQDSFRRVGVSPDEALLAVQSGHRVLVGSGCAVPQQLVEALCRRAKALEGVEVCHLLTMGEAPYVHRELHGHMRHNAFFIGPNTRKLVQSGEADFTPVFLSEIPALLTEGRLPVDVALITVSPPDEHGFCSYGVSVDVVKPAAEAAKVIIAEVNPRMPRTHGDAFIHIDRIHHVVNVDIPIPELPATAPSEVEGAIADHVAELVEDGATLQMGIGGIPNAVLRRLGAKRHLGIHTEMFSDGVLDLIKRGVVTGEKKSIHKGKIVTSFLMGSRTLYDFVDNNPMIEMHPSHYTNDPWVIAQNDKMTAINSALEVDLTGQVCACSIGPLLFSGVGGQVDFIRGASRSRGGKPIIALPATAKDGALSRVVPMLKTGAGVTTSRYDVRWVATEYGATNLHGVSVRERARALIALAAPQFREELTHAARERHLI